MRISIIPFLLSVYGLCAAGQDIGSIPYASYFGGSGTQVNAMTLDAQGNVYLAGQTYPSTLAGTQGHLQPQCSAALLCAFVAKVSADRQLVWSTYLGGAAYNSASAIGVDAHGNIYVAGSTGSADFPVTPDALRGKYPGTSGYHGTGFLVKLDAAASKLLYGTFLSADSADSVGGIVVSASGDLWLAGSTESPKFPLRNPVQNYGGGTCGDRLGTIPCVDAFAMKWRGSDMQLVWSTYIGGSAHDSVYALAADAQGNVFVTGATNSPDFPPKNSLPNVPPTDSQCLGYGGGFPFGSVPFLCHHVFVVKLSADGQRFVYAARLGGSGSNIDSGRAVVVDRDGQATIAGGTRAHNFPVVNSTEGHPAPGLCAGTGQSEPCNYSFVAKLNANGSALVWSRYFGGQGPNVVTSAAPDGDGGLYIGGSTQSRDFPVTTGAYQHCNGSRFLPVSQATEARAGFLVHIAGDGATVYSTLFGGSGSDLILALSADATGIWFAGSTISPDLPVTAEKFQLPYNGKTPIPTAAAPVRPNGMFAKHVIAPHDTSPHIDAVCVVNAAALLNGTVAPGEIVTIFGKGLGPAEGVGAQLDDQDRIAAEAGGVTVTFNGVPAPLLYAGPNQVNAIVPFEVTGTAAIVISVNGTLSNIVEREVTGLAPGIFTTDMSGVGQALALNQDGTLNSIANPAKRGSIMTVWMTGAGPLAAAFANGEIVGSPIPAAATIIMSTPFPVAVLYAGQAPGMVAGVFQVNFQVPLQVQEGRRDVDVYTVVVSNDGEVKHAPPVTISVE